MGQWLETEVPAVTLLMLDLGFEYASQIAQIASGKAVKINILNEAADILRAFCAVRLVSNVGFFSIFFFS